VAKSHHFHSTWTFPKTYLLANENKNHLTIKISVAIYPFSYSNNTQSIDYTTHSGQNTWKSQQRKANKEKNYIINENCHRRATSKAMA